MIKSFLKFLLLALAGLALILYISSIGEGMENLDMEGSYFENLPRTLEYFALWVLPYWWLILLIGGIVIAGGLTLINRKRIART